MGAHTLGRMHSSVSLLKYVWTVRQGNLFNNAYYKNIVKKNEWFLQSQVIKDILRTMEFENILR